MRLDTNNLQCLDTNNSKVDTTMNWSGWLAYALMVLSTLTVHELGHWAEMARNGIETERFSLGLGLSRKLFGRLYIGILPLGASVTPRPDQWRRATPYLRFRVAIAGPIASFCCGGMMLALGLFYPQFARGLTAFASMHLVLGMVNLIPVPPLDGWVAFSELLALKQRPLSQRAVRLASRVGNGVLYGVGFYFVGRLMTGSV
jgi:membrane-associated protease RseP (regulator of RpoE activity)